MDNLLIFIFKNDPSRLACQAVTVQVIGREPTLTISKDLHLYYLTNYPP